MPRIRFRPSPSSAGSSDWGRHHADRVLPVDERVADEWGRFSAQRNVAPFDVLMAATARAHGLILATRNTRDVAWTGVPCLNPFQFSG